MKKIVIIGGVATGANTATRLRRLEQDAEIILLEKGGYISFANCGLPYYIGGIVKEKEQLLARTVEEMKADSNIDARIYHEAIAIDKEAKTVTVKDHKAKSTYTLTYDKLVLAMGAKPIVLPGMEEDAAGVFSLRSIEDMEKIKHFIDEKKPKTALVIGAGAIGLEMADMFSLLEMDVTLCDLAPHAMTSLDYEMAAMVHEYLKDKGIHLVMNTGIEKLANHEGKVIATLQDGTQLTADIAIAGVGVRADTQIAKDAGIALTPSGHIEINEYLQTSDEDIYAGGDCVLKRLLPLDVHIPIALAGPATEQGRLIAENIAGRQSPYQGATATAIVQVGDLLIASVGANDKILRREQIAFDRTYLYGRDHAGYYPGAQTMACKLIFSPETGLVLGAQIVGKGGVDKRIDLLATAIGLGATVKQLEKIQLGYAPQVGVARDALNNLANSALESLEGDIQFIQFDEIDNKKAEGLLIDVRTPQEYEKAHIEQSVNIPLASLYDRLSTLPTDKPIYVYCASGARGYNAALMLLQNGFTDVYNMPGGFRIYSLAKSIEMP